MVPRVVIQRFSYVKETAVSVQKNCWKEDQNCYPSCTESRLKSNDFWKKNPICMPNLQRFGMLSSVPQQYVLMLKPCFKNNCLHPLCQAEANTLPEPTWFPSGPPLTYFPLPIPDTTRPWGADCNVCTGFCAGHYLKPEDAWKSYQEKGEHLPD